MPARNTAATLVPRTSESAKTPWERARGPFLANTRLLLFSETLTYKREQRYGDSCDSGKGSSPMMIVGCHRDTEIPLLCTGRRM